VTYRNVVGPFPGNLTQISADADADFEGGTTTQGFSGTFEATDDPAAMTP
jgi:hypothetical protein